MPVYTHIGSQRRAFSGLIHPDGSSVELDPDGQIDLDVHPGDRWLVLADPQPPAGTVRLARVINPPSFDTVEHEVAATVETEAHDELADKQAALAAAEDALARAEQIVAKCKAEVGRLVAEVARAAEVKAVLAVQTATVTPPPPPAPAPVIAPAVVELVPVPDGEPDPPTIEPSDPPSEVDTAKPSRRRADK